MMPGTRFVHDTLGQRICFGSGDAAVHIADEVDRLGGQRVMVVASERESAIADLVTTDVDVAHRHHEVRMHVPTEVADRARAAAQEHAVDVVVSVGGGSTTGLAKAVALTTGVPIVAVPTTYAGSEATDVWGLTEGDTKRTGSDPRVLPRAVVYDAELTTSMPARLSALSGLNALAHCVDSLWAPRADPINAALALEGVRALADGLPLVHDHPDGLDGREKCQYGAYLAAASFASAGSGLHHKICHVLGGTFDLPHADTHAIVLPYVVAFLAPYAPDAERRLAAALGASTALDGVEALRDRLDAPRGLGEIGLSEDAVPDAVRRVLDVVPASTPRPTDDASVTALLTAALRGTDPRSLT